MPYGALCRISAWEIFRQWYYRQIGHDYCEFDARRFDSLIEFINTIRQSAKEKEDLEIHLLTANDDEHRPDVIDFFDAITDDLAPHGIDFTYDFDADHDRFIHLDNGWKINLGRGMDIFDKVERFSIDRISQEERRCKACSIAFVRVEDDEETPGSL